MTHSSSSAPAAVAGRSAPRLLRFVAIGACLPYLGLKVAWIAGSHLGIPAGSPLLEHRLPLALANGLTVLMDACVVVLALLLTRPWGRRVPAWLLAVPMWTATGLLAPIMVGFPLQLLVRSGVPGGSGGGDDRAFLDDWVFGVVYGGFIVQGLALGTLFAGYAQRRWGRLWRGRAGELPAPATAPAQRLTALTALLLALVPGGLRLLWAAGSTAGLDGSTDRLLEVVHLLFLVAAGTGAWQLAFRRGRALPVTVPLVLAWAGSGATACWGGWMTLSTLVMAGDPAGGPTPAMSLTYAVQMIVGFLVATLVARYFADRSAEEPR
ncbi:hypothetical protein JK359_31370 [Streptomyces actinomycinicus]|uniref:Aromatic ring-opening dioxygenase LigA n=1 Tax=Streptomyces actinomycinicus TaxID=1695166 RepID=A0A937EQ91_9ACTN|nr:hypothetical protein [Streptomyces actinomycinicus]MBL1086415.1 hypothetical protein [Streptomyces actinomycinicus]